MILDISKKISEKVKIKISDDETLEVEALSVIDSAEVEEKINEAKSAKEKIEYVIEVLHKRGFDKKYSSKVSSDTLLEIFSLVSGTNKKK